MRVHQEGLLQLVCRAGKLAQDQRAVVLRAGSDVFLGHKVHSVPQGSNQHDVRGEVERHHFLDRVAVVQVAYGRVLDGVVGAVDVAHGALDLLTQEPVLFHALTAGAGHLDECGVADGQLAFVEKFLEGLEPVPDALGVVQPVDTQEDGFGVAKVLADLAGALDDLRLVGQLADLGNIDGDGE